MKVRFQIDLDSGARLFVAKTLAEDESPETLAVIWGARGVVVGQTMYPPGRIARIRWSALPAKGGAE